MSIHSLISDPQALLELEPEELAGVLLEYLNSLTPSEEGQLRTYHFSLDAAGEYPKSQRENLSEALMEVWVWLEREGLLVPRAGIESEWVFISRRGRKLTTRKKVDHYRKENLLPCQRLHPRIAGRVWASFLRGDYDTAVFQSFKGIEVLMPEARHFAGDAVGVDLMRRAFGPKGSLTDRSALNAEREALANLFAGALGTYKNPTSHRNVTIESSEAVEMIILASHLLYIVDQHSSN